MDIDSRVAAKLKTKSFKELAEEWSKEHKPSTALRYGLAAAKVIKYQGEEPPSHREKQSIYLILRSLKKKNAVFEPRQAVPAQPHHIHRLMKLAPLDIWATAVLLFTSISRHDDLEQLAEICFSRISETQVKLKIPIEKSQQFGRGFFKFVTIPAGMPLPSEGMQYPTYNRFLYQVQKYCPELSSHSFRRGGFTAAADKFDHSQIVKLSGHGSDDLESARRYTAPKPEQIEPTLQLQISSYLCSILC